MPHDLAAAVDFDHPVVELICDEIVAALVELAVVVGGGTTRNRGACGRGNQEGKNDSVSMGIHGTSSSGAWHWMGVINDSRGQSCGPTFPLGTLLVKSS